MYDNRIETYRSAFPEDIEAVRYDLEQHGDSVLSARLTDAAARGSWQEVTRLLAEGADPRICRNTAGGGCRSALYFSLNAKKFEVAEALVRAGDRLDDLRLGKHDGLPGEALDFLAAAAARGVNVFVEEGKPLSECIRCGLWAQTRAAMEHAPRVELNLSVKMIGLYFSAGNAVEYLRILDELLARGANPGLIALTRGEMRQQVLSLPEPARAQFMEKVPEFFAEGAP